MDNISLPSNKNETQISIHGGEEKVEIGYQVPMEIKELSLFLAILSFL
jgi:hypothetical protein